MVWLVFRLYTQIRLGLLSDAILQVVKQTTPPHTDKLQQKLGFTQGCGGAAAAEILEVLSREGGC